MHTDDGQGQVVVPSPLTQEFVIALLRHPTFEIGFDISRWTHPKESAATQEIAFSSLDATD